MKEDWKVVAEIPDKTLREILLEEGIPEEDIDKEVEKLKKNATVTIGIRAILITPEVDSILKSIFEYADIQGFDLRDGFVERDKRKGEFDRAKEALWPR